MPLAKICRTAHIYLSLFFLPLALLYALTGICYLCGQPGGTESRRFTVPSGQPPAETAGAKGALIRSVLSANGVQAPSGEGRELRGRFTLGRPTGRNAVLEPAGRDGKEAAVTLNSPDLLMKLMLLHKAKCGAAFNVLGIAFGGALLLVYLSGILLVWNAAGLRKKLFAALAIGLAVTVAAALASL